MKRPFSPEEFKEIYSKVPRVCIDLVIKTPKGIPLLLRKLPSWHGKWHLPGGTVLYKETIVEAINRIADEELGISVEVIELLGYIEFPNEEKERGFGHTVSIAFLCSANITNNITNIRPNEEASDLKIFNELPENIIEEQREFLKPILAQVSG